MGFRLLGIHIQVAPSFLLFQVGLAVFVAITVQTTPALRWIAIGVVGAIVLVSVVVHEMGHALTARHAGLEPEITLTWFGGFTRFVAGVGPGRRLWISAAGVAYQGVLAALVWVLMTQGVFGDAGLPRTLAQAFVWFNLFMAGVNLIPVGGMDGGAILGSLLELLEVPRPRLVLLVVYGVGGVAITIWGVSSADWFVTLAGLYLTYAGVRGQAPYVQYEIDALANPELEPTIRRLLLTGRHAEAAELALRTLEDADSAPYRIFATTVHIDALRIAGETERLQRALAALDTTGVDPLPLGQAHGAVGDIERARTLLMPAVTRRDDPLAASELARLLVEGRDFEGTVSLVGRRPDLFHPLAGLDVHRRLIERRAGAAAAAVRDIMSAQRGVRAGAIAHMLIAEGLVEEGLALLRRDHELGATWSSAVWLDHGLTMAGRVDRSVRVHAESLPGAIETEEAEVLVRLLVGAEEFDRAASIGTTAARADEASDDLRYDVATALDATGDVTTALELLERSSPRFLLRKLPEERGLTGVRAGEGYAALVESLAVASA